MLHACDQIFDMMGNLENFCELNKALLLHDLGDTDTEPYVAAILT